MLSDRGSGNQALRVRRSRGGNHVSVATRSVLRSPVLVSVQRALYALACSLHVYFPGLEACLSLPYLVAPFVDDAR